MNERISIIIPVHNTESYLKRCVDSVLTQTYKELEIILVENLSTDNSGKICDEYAKFDSRIKVLHLDVADLSTARNEGIKIATGSYIAFVDSDDYISSEMYEVLLANQKKYNADISMCTYVMAYEGKRCRVPILSSSDIKVYSGVDGIRGILKNELSNASWDKLYRKELFDKVLFPEGYFYEDHFTMLKWFELCNTIVYTSNVYYYYWQRDDSICHDFNPVRGYHYFLADFYRWDYVRRTGILSGHDLRQFSNKVVYSCYYNFRQVICSLSTFNDFKNEIGDMQKKLKKMYDLKNQGLHLKNHLRLLKTTYFWGIYSFFLKW